MKISASEFKAKCLALIDKVQETGEPITITKRGRVVAKLSGESAEGERPWLILRQRPVRWKGDPFAPAVNPRDIETLK